MDKFDDAAEIRHRQHHAPLPNWFVRGEGTEPSSDRPIFLEFDPLCPDPDAASESEEDSKDLDGGYFGKATGGMSGAFPPSDGDRRMVPPRSVIGFISAAIGDGCARSQR